MTTAHQQSTKVCPVCGESSEARAAICWMCYAKLERVPAATRTVAAPMRRGRLRRRRRLAALVALVTVVLALRYAVGIGAPAPIPVPVSARSVLTGNEAWPMGDGGAGARRSTGASPPSGGTIVWRRRFEAAVTTPPVTDGATAYVALADARLVALDLADGRVRWDAPLDGPLDAAPTLAGDRLYVGRRSGLVSAIEAASGRLIWSTDIGSPIWASPVVSDGAAFIVTSDAVAAVDAEDGALLWSHALPEGFVRGIPVIAADRLAVATSQNVQFFDRHSGHLTYTFILRGVTRIAAAPGAVVAATDRRAYAIDPQAATPWWYDIRAVWANMDNLGLAPPLPALPSLWANALPGGMLAPVLTEDAVLFTSVRGEATMYDLRTGSPRWTRQIEGLVAAPIATRAGLFAVRAHELALFDPRTGAQVRSETLAIAEPRMVGASAAAILIIAGAGQDELIVIR